MPLIGKQFRLGLRGSLRFQMDSGVRYVPVLHLKFGENHGDMAYDSSPYGNNGDIKGPSWTKGILGPGLSFDGVNDYVNCGNNKSLDILDALTIEMWVKFFSLPATESVILLGKDSDTLGRSYTMDWAKIAGFTGLRLYINGGGPLETIEIRYAWTPELNRWYHVVGTWGAVADEAYLYVNGSVVKTSTTPKDAIAISTASVYIGARQYVGYEGYLNGVIDEARIYSRSLTAREILELYYGIE